MVCVETWHMQTVLKAQINKTGLLVIYLRSVSRS